MDRDYQLVERLSKLGDDVMIGVSEVAALTGLAHITVQQRRTKMLPPPIYGSKPLRWRLGDLRAKMRGDEQSRPLVTKKR
jgi:hypothetical protein